MGEEICIIVSNAVILTRDSIEKHIHSLRKINYNNNLYSEARKIIVTSLNMEIIDT